MANEPEFPTPKQEDVLFASDKSNWKMDAILNLKPGDDYAYRQGYRRAGRILTEHVARNGNGDFHGEVDFLVFPICHAYRHHVELSLKRLILLASHVAGRVLTTTEEKLQNGSHNLMSLWEAFKTINGEAEARTGIAVPPEHTDGIEAYICQLDVVDAGSFSFRYPLAKDGNVNLDNIKRINLGNFSDHMEKLCDYLDGWDCCFVDIIQTNVGNLDDACGKI